jgi:hypothetical protein
VFGILSNITENTITNTNLLFFLDDNFVGIFDYDPSPTSDMRYNVTIYAQDGLKDGPHQLVIKLKMNSVLLFDYALYT